MKREDFRQHYSPKNDNDRPSVGWIVFAVVTLTACGFLFVEFVNQLAR